jgi:hypothetical protein
MLGDGQRHSLGLSANDHSSTVDQYLLNRHLLDRLPEPADAFDNLQGYACYEMLSQEYSELKLDC